MDAEMKTKLNEAGCDRQESSAERTIRILRGAAKDMENMANEIRSLNGKLSLVEGLIRLAGGNNVGVCSPTSGGYTNSYDLNRAADQIEKEIAIAMNRARTSPPKS